MKATEQLILVSVLLLQSVGRDRLRDCL